MEFVSWDDDIPNINGKIQLMFQTTNLLYNITARRLVLPGDLQGRYRHVDDDDD